MKEYVVKVFENGTKYWYLDGELHREDGAAVEWSNGYKAWFLNGIPYTEEAFNAIMNPEETIEVNGHTYKLVDEPRSINKIIFLSGRQSGKSNCIKNILTDVYDNDIKLGKLFLNSSIY